jgi:hypothetical protein
MDETRIWGLKKIGALIDCGVFRRTYGAEATMAGEERMLHFHLLGLGIVGSLAAACVLATVFAGCASPASRDTRDAAPGSSAADPSAAARPRFAQGGPDAEDYGASSGYPIGDQATCLRGSESLAYFVGCHSHFDQVYEGRLMRRATTPSPLARAASEPAVRYEYQGQTFTLDDYLARNPATGAPRYPW